MDIRIIKEKVRYCMICEEVSELKDAWDLKQAELMENGEIEDPEPFPGVSGYTIKDSDQYKYGYNNICERCMNTVVRGVQLINTQKLTGISIDSNVTGK